MCVIKRQWRQQVARPQQKIIPEHLVPIGSEPPVKIHMR